MTTAASKIFTYIYALVDPRTSAIRYIGKADDPDFRLKRHIHDATADEKHLYKSRWINELARNGLSPELKILERCAYDNWASRERYWIRNTPNLTNIADGGQGSTCRIRANFKRVRRLALRSAGKGKAQTHRAIKAILRCATLPTSHRDVQLASLTWVMDQIGVTAESPLLEGAEREDFVQQMLEEFTISIAQRNP